MTVLAEAAPGSAPAPERAGVVGGGLLGMTVALRLAERGARVTLYERDAVLGGLAQPWELGDVTWDRHYHVVLGSDRTLHGLLTELGVADQLVWSRARTGFAIAGRVAELTSVRDFLRFPTLGTREKARLGFAILRAAAIRDGVLLESITARDWLRGMCGKRVYDTVWRPLLIAKVGAAEPDVSAAFIWAIIARMFGARRGTRRAETFGYIAGGYAGVIDRFRARLTAAGVDIRTGVAVSGVFAKPDGIAIVDATGRTSEFERGVLTVPAGVAARLCHDLPPAERAAWEGIAYQGIVCASLLLSEAVSPYYITNIADERAPFSAIIEMSSIVDRREFGGKHLVYLPKYTSSDSPLFGEDDAVIRERFVAGLQAVHPRFSPDTIEAFRISRVRDVFPVPAVRLRERVPPMTTSIPHLTIVNTAHITNGTLNVNETLDLAGRAVALLDRQVSVAR